MYVGLAHALGKACPHVVVRASPLPDFLEVTSIKFLLDGRVLSTKFLLDGPVSVTKH